MLYNKYKIKHFQRDIEPHEVFLDKLAKAKEEESGLTEKKLEVPLKEKTSRMLLNVFLLLALILFLKTFYLQIIEGKRLYAASENNKRRIAMIIPERGIIYDKNLKKLVSNLPAFDLVCDKRRFSPSVSQALREIQGIADLTGRDFQELKKEIEKSKDPKILVFENISHEKLLVFEANINDFPACRIEENTVRDYVSGKSFSHLLGYTGKISRSELESRRDYAVNDYIGKTGLEAFYEDFLRGRPGAVEEIKNVVGLEKGEKELFQPESGKNLVLNIDSILQERLYSGLEDGIKKVVAKKGAAVAIDPRDGAVLAMVSYPSYDNNLFSKGILQKDFDKIQNDISKPLFNRAIAAQYPIGSTIKPFIASAALQEKIISPAKQINDKGYIEVRSRYDPSVVYRFSGIKPHGLVDIKKAIAVSSNVYFYTVGGGYEDQQGLGPAGIKKYLELFGWSEKTGIDIPGEFSGFVPNPEWKKQKKKEPWWDGDTYNLSIGQSDLQITPLQVAMAYGAIANGGTLHKPRIVRKITNVEGNILAEFGPEIIRSNFIDPENLQVVREGMREAVLYGSSVSLNGLPVTVAAKTGTVEIPEPGHYNAWISAFAPYKNPEIVLVITIESVEGIRAAVLPIARDVLNWYFGKK